MKREKITEAILVIALGLVAIYLLSEKHQPVFLYIALVLGVTGILIRPLAGWIAVLWYKIGDLLGLVVSKILLTVIFFFLLVPISILYRLFHKDPLHLRRSYQSAWSVRDHDYTEDDMKNIW